MLLSDYCIQGLALLKEKNLYRTLRPEKTGRSFSTNHYLGRRFGAGASRLMRAASNTASERLEKALAKWKEKPAALVFPTGYMANVGVISALMGKGDLIILDKLCHASLIDGAYLSRAELRVYKHNDIADLQNILNAAKNKYKKILVITESVFSMDGDQAPLQAIFLATREHGAWLMVDEAHAIGVFGKKGSGLLNTFGLSEVEIVTGTLSKAIGGLGGYVAGSAELKAYLINRARAFIYTTALPKSVIVQNLKGLKKMSARVQKKLWQNIDYFYTQAKALPIAKPQSAIIPLVIGDEIAALRFAQKLEDQGFSLSAVRYPTVPKGKARLRITITAEQSKKDIARLVKALHAGCRPTGRNR